MEPRLVRIINGLQTGFPLTSAPFRLAADRLNLTEEELIQGIAALLADGDVTRFGPFFNAERWGGGVTLAAMRVPVDDYEQVAALVNAQPEVAHNYAREHALNMWFVVATERKEQIHAVLARLSALTGLEVFNLPKLEEYRLGFQVVLRDDGGVDSCFLEDPPIVEHDREPDTFDRAVIAATQAGISLIPEPYAEIARGLGVDEERLLERMQWMIRCGWMRRIGLATNHYRLGLKGNGMSVWSVPDERVRALGRQIGTLDFVTHCYRRPRHLPTWPYNLFVMVHGADRSAVAAKVQVLAEVIGADNQGHLVLHSTRILKKTGLRLSSFS
ncbi:MAG: Lrp/AsnC family transcriptional regulator [Magnetococcales bacterium]|nr:Lrp/AsnC family transcriptional regulator [Magnetococcales bacterium]